MIPKPQRIVDKKLLKEMANVPCEVCGSRWAVVAHHVTTKGAGGHDLPENLISLCTTCHNKAHYGGITKRRLLEIVRGRDGISMHQLQKEIY